MPKSRKMLLDQLKQKLGIENSLALPKLDRVVISCGIAKIKDQPLLDQIKKDLSLIAGQKPVVTKSKQSIAGFKSRRGESIGLVVTLHGWRMMNFLTKLILVALPAIRDFRGIGVKSFDSQGNLTIGFREYTVFPEISYVANRVSHGLEVTVVIRAPARDQAIELMKAYGLPIRE